MARIRIAFFVSNLQQGGAERQLVELLKGIDKDKFEIHLYLYAYQQDTFYKEIFDINSINIETNRLKHKNVILKVYEALRYIYCVTKRNQFDILFSTLFMNNLFIRIASPFRYNNRIISNSRNSISIYTKYHLFAEKILIRRSFLVFNSENAQVDFKKVIPKKFHYRLFSIYNGYNTTSPPKKRTILKTGNCIMIGGLGRQDHQKNFLQLASVFNKLTENKQVDKNIRLILQGKKGNESEKINDLLKNKQDIVSILEPNPETEKFYSSIDILVIPSYYEGCPNVLFEAMQYKCLCIISNGANSDNFITDGVNGFVYDGSDEGLSQSIIEVISLLCSKEELQITENAFQYVKENFSLEVMVNKYEKLFSVIYEKNQSSN